ncbi:DNA sulfur modification protein DndD [Halapricum salinum]|uniref:DNA sulfur modification protein DndD n=1 Tax=Halapricum salinum TaxID=1457250 RepID=A0A4D6HDW5_9EURY|nr:DNA sulfur modification protein DndD [Halapricum salinum]QCC51446.1 DNA sulfur modification protein DndD [Halapricum salinum]
MKLNRLVVTNYGPYKGQNAFNLNTTHEEPIVLFGGANGAGKTTLFNAIPLCLHGRSAFDERVSEREYHNRIRSKLHESNGEKATEASIRLEFEYGNLGDTEEYVVERQWRDRGKSIEETLMLMRNGSKLSDLQEDKWQDFLKELIPPGISQLFFFDGEKVQKLASAIEKGEEFEQSLLSLLGLDLVERLDADLSVYLSSKLDESGHEQLAEEIESLRHEKADLEVEYDKLESKIEKKRQRVDKISEEIDKKETELAQEGGGFARERDSLKERKRDLDQEIEEVREEIRKLASESYPFALVPGLCREVVEQLKEEQEAETEAAAQARVVSELDELTDDETVWSDLNIPDDASEEVIERLQVKLSESLQTHVPEPSLSKDFSQREQEQMFSVVEDALHRVPPRLSELTEELEDKTRERQDVTKQLKRAPEQSVLSPILDEINELNEKQGKLKSEIEDHVERLETLETKIGRLESELEKKYGKQEDLEDVSERAELASRTRKAVQEYHDELVREKLDRLEDALTERYLRLTNKSGFYDNVIINPEEITIEIETINGERKEQSQLSAGERQIFATALLWALAEISDRPLPFIIDTPLGRLDQEHRQNLVEGFFPEAAHQVLLFSTDTEITEEYYNILENDIANEYHLQQQEETGRTEITPGYFWTTDERDTGDNEVETAVEQQAELPFNND